MSDNWIRIKRLYSKPPTDYTKSGSVHETRDEALIIEEHADKFVIFIVEKHNPDTILYEVERGIPTLDKAKDVASSWMDEHPDGLDGV